MFERINFKRIKAYIRSYTESIKELRYSREYIKQLRCSKEEWNKFYDDYRERNRHNSTYPENIFDMNYVSVGKKSYGGIKLLGGTHSLGQCISKIRIGSYCSIGPEVTFIPHLDHYTNHISTYPFKVYVMGEKFEAISKGDIVIDDDVWIGYGATILSGVHIGQGAIIMAGAVVSKDIPPYAMAGGVPAKPIKYRFNESIIEKLLKIDFSRLDDELIKEHINELYETVNEDTDLSWLPLKEDTQI